MDQVCGVLGLYKVDIDQVFTELAERAVIILMDTLTLTLSLKGRGECLAPSPFQGEGRGEGLSICPQMKAGLSPGTGGETAN